MVNQSGMKAIGTGSTSLEIGVQPVSQIIEVPEIKEEFKDILAVQFPERNEVPLHPFRLGYAKSEERTPRRTVEEVLMPY